MVFGEFLYHVSSICVLNFMRKYYRLIFICEFIKELVNSVHNTVLCILCCKIYHKFHMGNFETKSVYNEI
jgi:hypothetical protein